jgi:hypothetical protein
MHWSSTVDESKDGKMHVFTALFEGCADFWAASCPMGASPSSGCWLPMKTDLDGVSCSKTVSKFALGVRMRRVRAPLEDAREI